VVCSGSKWMEDVEDCVWNGNSVDKNCTKRTVATNAKEISCSRVKGYLEVISWGLQKEMSMDSLEEGGVWSKTMLVFIIEVIPCNEGG